MNKDELKKKIIEANEEYRAGKSSISDLEYDQLVEEFKDSWPEEYDQFRDSLNEGSIEYGIKVKHDFIMGSLDKIKNTDQKSLNDFIRNHVKEKLNISAKVDGISSIAKYVNGKLVEFASRGTGYEGVSYFDKSKYVKGLPQRIDIKDTICIRGELVILKDEIVDSDTNYRNVCAGYMNSKYWKKEEISKVSFIPYTILGDKYTKNEQFELLEKLGLNVAWHKNIDPKQENLQEALTNYAKIQHEYDCDGLVLIGENSYNEQGVYRPKNSKAYKINELKGITKIIDIDWGDVSKDGYLIPVFVLEPIELGGALISRATASNLDILEKLNAKYGSIVEITKSGDIIPHVDRIVENPEGCIDIVLPEECPCCKSKLVREGLNLRCVNKSCKNQIIEQITQFIKKLGCKHASNATIEKFNILSFEDLVNFIPNKKYKSEMTLYKELQNNVFTKSRQELLAATNFVGLAEKMINKIVEYYGFDNIEKNVFNGLPEGVGDITLSKFKENIKQNLDIVQLILNDKRYSYVENRDKTVSTKKIGSVCFTGALSTMSRNEASAKAMQAGYEVKSGVSKGLTYLITNTPDSGSSKNKKAKELGTKVITEEEFIKLISNQSNDINIFDL